MSLPQAVNLYFHWLLHKFKIRIALLKYGLRCGNEIAGNTNVDAIAQRHGC